MRTRSCLFILCLQFVTSSYGQIDNFSSKEIRELHFKIQSFIVGQDSLFTEGRLSEFVQLIFRTDNNGIISKIHQMGIETDSLYKILKKMDAGYFSSWKGPKNKTIIIPYFYLSENSVNIGNYVDKLFADYYVRIPGGAVMNQSDNTVMIKWFKSVTPLRPPEGNRPDETILISSKKDSVQNPVTRRD